MSGINLDFRIPSESSSDTTSEYSSESTSSEDNGYIRRREIFNRCSFPTPNWNSLLRSQKIPPYHPDSWETDEFFARFPDSISDILTWDYDEIPTVFDLVYHQTYETDIYIRYQRYFKRFCPTTLDKLYKKTRRELKVFTRRQYEQITLLSRYSSSPNPNSIYFIP